MADAVGQACFILRKRRMGSESQESVTLIDDVQDSPNHDSDEE